MPAPQHKITVTIAGPAASGKTALRRILQRILTKADVEWEVQDSDYKVSPQAKEKGMMEDIANDLATSSDIQTKKLVNSSVVFIEDHKTVKPTS